VAFVPSARNVMWDRALVGVFKTTTQNRKCDVFDILNGRWQVFRITESLANRYVITSLRILQPVTK
jgi:hypothetical protein